jgi:hypothetical protein
VHLTKTFLWQESEKLVKNHQRCCERKTRSGMDDIGRSPQQLTASMLVKQSFPEISSTPKIKKRLPSVRN